MAVSFSTVTQNFQTIIDFLRFALSKAHVEALYYGHGTDNAWDDMHALVLDSLSLPFDVDPMLLQARLTDEEKAWLCRQLERRIRERIPVPYLTHKAYFCDLEFYVDERVLIPRSPIAELIDCQFSPWVKEEKVDRILDLCTGSGCIAIACCYAFPHALVDAVDVSADALEVAKINSERHDVQDVLTLIQSDCFEDVPHHTYDLIISNPPYVGREEMERLPDEYRHEPKLALETENNGLAIAEKILHHAHAYLSDHGVLVVEVGNSQEALMAAYPDVPFTWLEFERGGHGVFLLTKAQLNDYFANL
ncbi:50S ribosomal protein L3 N(5)-glutamine methyltransferase [Legionella nagasakiensis]|uniref:50S ribosomal protein L3 N(5)-glutamine methyltransferase n=1 Tax=Legionella nagasakiensis TaxID=535290 RepID=UPI0010548D82|nr:50S ribosomal protein L3 N(5)-glutamine methyltransferase [Legionella nagasakiensis]